MRGPC